MLNISSHYSILSLVILVLFLNTAHAQRMVSGTITATENGAPIHGVNVLFLGTSTGTVSDAEGKYEIEVPNSDAVLIFSFIGFETQEVPVGNQSVMNIAMIDDVQYLSDVVVTALGISKDKKSVGYAVQDLSGEELAPVKDGNIVNSFAGKIAGVQVTGNSSSVGGSSNIIIRGISSITGNNQPLFIVDGTPVDNSNFNTHGTNNSSGGIDYGNAAMDINPDDVESVTVLKGANAAALYGSRAANGVIMITTKNGENRKGIGVTFSTSLMVNQPAVLPNYQNEYGGGYKQEFDIYDPTREPVVNYAADESWGPRMEGQLVRQWYSWFEDDPDYGKMTPFLPHPDNVKDFYETGIATNNSLSLEGGNENTRFRLGYTNYRESGIIPNAQLKRNSIAIAASSKLTDKFTVSSNINLVHTNNENIPGQGYHPRQTNVVTSFNMWFQRQIDMNKLKNYKTPEGRDRSWNIKSTDDLDPLYLNNPYWVLNESPQNMERQRVYGNISLAYEFIKGLTLQGWARTDYYTDRREERIASYSIPTDFYGESVRMVRENNFELLLQYSTGFGESWSLNANLGVNSRKNTYHNNGGSTVGGLNVPNLFNLEASKDRPNITDINSEKVINSVYGSVNIGFNGMLFLDATLRKDWSSTLPAEHNSYIYPSVSGSWIFSELFNSNIITLGKLRASWAQVGNDTSPYQLDITYQSQPNYGNLPAYAVSWFLPNANLKPERVSTKEYGVEMNFFKDRLGIDVSYYDISSIDQILALNISGTSGFYSAWINAGELTNKGWEVVLKSRILKSPRGFNWNLGINWALNRNEVVELIDSLKNYQIASSWGASINAKIGQPYGTWATDGFVYHENGERIVDNNGYFKRITNQDYGSYLPNWTGGIINTFEYKGITLYALIDFQEGGQILSVSNMIGNWTGLLAETVTNNAMGNPQRDPVDKGGGIRADGVFEDGEPNDKYIESEDYWNSLVSRKEYYLYDASFIKLRELSLAYQFPARISGPFSSIQLAFVGRNLAILYKNVPNVDPETTYGSGNIQGFENGQHPSIRSYGFRLKLSL